MAILVLSVKLQSIAAHLNQNLKTPTTRNNGSNTDTAVKNAVLNYSHSAAVIAGGNIKFSPSTFELRSKSTYTDGRHWKQIRFRSLFSTQLSSH